MGTISITALQPYLFIAAGIGGLLYTVFKKTTNSQLKTTGEKAEGIIFDQSRVTSSISFLDNSQDVSGKVNSNVTVRFVTKKQEWITGDIKQGFAIFFTGQYKNGDKVDVYYEPNNPSNFMVDTKQSEALSRILIVVVSFIFLGIGLYQLLATSTS